MVDSGDRFYLSALSTAACDFEQTVDLKQLLLQKIVFTLLHKFIVYFICKAINYSINIIYVISGINSTKYTIELKH